MIHCELKLIYSEKIKHSDRFKINSPSDAIKYLKTLYDKDSLNVFESLYIIVIDRQNRVIGHRLLSQGGFDMSVACVRSIFSTALISRCSGIILTHNHPSGSLAPSKSDKDITRRVIEAGKLLDLIVLDHIIVTEEDCFSFAENGMMTIKALEKVNYKRF